MRTIATAALIAVLVILLLALGCGKKAPEQVAPPPPPQVTVSPPAEAPSIPEITQAEQNLEELDTQDLDEVEKDVDALTLP